MLFITGVFNKCLFLARLALRKMYYLEVGTQYILDKNVVSSKHVIYSVVVIYSKMKLLNISSQR